MKTLSELNRERVIENQRYLEMKIKPKMSAKECREGQRQYWFERSSVRELDRSLEKGKL